MTLAEAPLVICVAPNGARRLKVDHPAIPLDDVEMVAVAEACMDAGATVLHLHVRDAAGRHVLDADRYRRAQAAIERVVGDRLLVQVTTESAGLYEAPAQMSLVRDLVPAAVSVAMREIFGGPEGDGGVEREAASFYAWCSAHAVGIQHIVYSAEEARRLVELARRGLLSEDRPHALVVLGRYAAAQRPSEPRDLLSFLAVWPEEWPWTSCAFGATEARVSAAAIGLGGHVRVGFENNVLRPDGAPASSNAESVANARALGVSAGRPLATIDDTRRLYTPGRL